MEIRFDPIKRDETLRKRGLDFARAGDVFAGRLLTLEDDRYDYPEVRYQTYGWIDDRMALVVWTPIERGIRVISMRYCHAKEQRRIAPRLG